ncbi:hypothetical protein [Ekhidna sp.]|uniref:hypothetical protein n=1 Tax=Ekhidna sp. TaxID=2608089 RepID=UPI003BA94F88
MNLLKYTPEKYISTEHESIAGVLNMGLILLPAFLSIVLIRQLVQLDFDMAMIITSGIIVALIAHLLFLRGRLHESIMTVVVFFTIFLTIVCSLGNGIHDIGLIGFPILIGFSSIILDERQLIIASILSVFGLLWLVLGERFNLFDPVAVPSGNTGDFIIASLMIVLGGFVAFSLTSNMKNSLKKANHEVSTSKKEATKLIEEIKQKEAIIPEIHKAVINSLNYIQYLIDSRSDHDENLRQVYKSLKRKILVIETAHETLLNQNAPLMLDLINLTQTLLNRFEKELKAQIFEIDIQKGSCMIKLDQAIYFGICLLELINDADEHEPKHLRVELSINNEVKLRLSHGNIQPEGSTLITDLLSKQLKGVLSRSEKEIVLSFEPIQAQ